MRRKENKSGWTKLVLAVFLAFSVLISLFNIIIDPFLHFHKPLPQFQYSLLDERYENDGIERHFDYEIMITGTSMSQNFHASLFEEMYGMKTIKTAFSGATFHELSENMARAIGYNPELKLIVCSFDPNMINAEYNEYAYDAYPYYLYDKNILNDVRYVLNKDVLMKSIAVINYTRAGHTTTSMDEYGRFDTYLPTGKEAVLSSFSRMAVEDLSVNFTDEDRERIRKNVTENYISLAKANPNVLFAFYIPPYSACYWDAMKRTNQQDYCIDSINYAIGLMLEQDNIRIYSFENWTDVMWNLDYYMDTLHYNGEICDRIAEAIWKNENRISDEYPYFGEIISKYTSDDYDVLFE